MICSKTMNEESVPRTSDCPDTSERLGRTATEAGNERASGMQPQEWGQRVRAICEPRGPVCRKALGSGQSRSSSENRVPGGFQCWLEDKCGEQGQVHGRVEELVPWLGGRNRAILWEVMSLKELKESHPPSSLLSDHNWQLLSLKAFQAPLLPMYLLNPNTPTKQHS